MAVRKELEVIERTCDLLRWSLPVLGSLPRSHRFVIGERVERQVVAILEELVRAKYAKDKRAHLEEASICLDLVRYQVRVLADDGMIKPGSYREFRLRDPKPRVIAAPAYRDRVVHHALMRVVAPVWERRFIDQSYACREGKGLHRAAEACRRHARRYAWALRIDVRRFYESIDHGIVKGIFRRDLGASRIVDLLDRVVDSHAPGIPIGSLASQWFALRVLDPVDHCVQDFLGVPIVRHMDDMLCFGAGKAGLRRIAHTAGCMALRLGGPWREGLDAPLPAPHAAGQPGADAAPGDAQGDLRPGG